jgi:hypothetical protein
MGDGKDGRGQLIIDNGQWTMKVTVKVKVKIKGGNHPAT